jgi:hypothetical protein
VPEPEMVEGVMLPQVSPGGTVSVRVTVPANPFKPATVIVVVKIDPAVPDGEDAVTVKSAKLNTAVEKWARVPLVPVTVTV